MNNNTSKTREDNIQINNETLTIITLTLIRTLINDMDMEATLIKNGA